MKMPSGMEYWTADEVAECVSGIPNALCGKLWSFLAKAKNPTPNGGDGGPDRDGRPTVETPDMRMDLDNDDKAGHWWAKLSEEEQKVIAEAYIKEYGK